MVSVHSHRSLRLSRTRHLGTRWYWFYCAMAPGVTRPGQWELALQSGRNVLTEYLIHNVRDSIPLMRLKGNCLCMHYVSNWRKNADEYEASGHSLVLRICYT